MTTRLGIDIGSAAIKAALITEDTTTLTEGGPFRLLSKGAGENFHIFPAREVEGDPVLAAKALLEEVKAALGELPPAILTGSGGKVAAKSLNIQFLPHFRCLAEGIHRLYPETRAILEMGGENSRFIAIESIDGSVKITDSSTSGDCAAGTGSFIAQQSSRLRYDVEEVGQIALSAKSAAKIAGRCSVFAKSDMIHAQQKGATPPEILRGLCDAVARNFKSVVTRSRELGGAPIALVGGVALNGGVVRAMKELYGDALFVPEAPAHMGAVGAALLARGEEAHQETAASTAKTSNTFPHWPPLSLAKVKVVEAQPPPEELPSEGYLGVDIGSVSTNLVLTSPDGALIHGIYLRTEARPVEAVKRGMEELREKFGGSFKVLGAATTGSGRELIGELIGADIVSDEITAHKTGSFNVAKLHLGGRKVDTIFEIGGQDSKFISLDDSVVTDFTMNEACAAGTGSFLEEQAERLGISIIGEFSEIALAAKKPLRLGERCTVYMESDLSSLLAKGASRDDAVAGLAFSVVQNYLNRVVRGRKIKDTIFFQGGTAYNHSVAAAFSQILGKEVIIPPHCGVIGAYGAALLAKERRDATGKPSTFRGLDLDSIDLSIRDFTCNGCSNSCDVKEYTILGVKSYWGDKCSERFRKPSKTEKTPVIEDLVAFRKEALERDWLSYFEEGFGGDKLAKLASEARQSAPSASPRFGFLRSLYYFHRYPFWRTYLEALGGEVVLTGPTGKRTIAEGVAASVAEPCFPIQAAHGHMAELGRIELDRIVLPSHINEEQGPLDSPSLQSHLCPWGQTLPFVLAHSPASAPEEKVISPLLHFRQGEAFVERELWGSFKPFAKSRKAHRAAVALAYGAQRGFTQALLGKGEEALAAIEEAGEAGVILIGRPYNLSDPGLNMGIPSRLRRDYGVNVIPMDFIPSANEKIDALNDNMFWAYGRRILQTALWSAGRDNMHLIYLTNFKCGPDSYLKTFASRGAVKPFLTLQFDAHAGDAGMMTRCEAYLDSKGLLRWWR
ncbi:MAG: hypothetical protein C0609_01535 [Deltaproteobacteria bacterium]|nr:MAG: hypothetical protein C0609_01535 [Deltaproteobacteria bacterium]